MWQYYYAGESHLVVELGSTIDLSINSDVHALAGTLVALQPRGLREVVPSYRSLMISYDPLVITAPELRAICQGLMKSKAICRPHQREVLEIPVRYGGELGPDLEQVAEETSLTVEEVVAMHVRRAYAVYMIGFLPGFPYFGQIRPQICPASDKLWLETPYICHLKDGTRFWIALAKEQKVICQFPL